MKKDITAFGIGIGSKNANGKWLEVFYPRPLVNPSEEFLANFLSAAELKQGLVCKELDQNFSASFPSAVQGDLLPKLLKSSGEKRDKKRCRVVLVFFRKDQPVTQVAEAYLKLHLISHRLVTPNSLNLTGIFKVLPNVAWTNKGAIDLEEVEECMFKARRECDYFRVYAIDKFPPLTDYVIPKGVRIADTARVRLGAYLGTGTTVMHAGFVNFNAGTAGPNMVEGRVSQGVFIDTGSDLGGGASTMGVLSGGNEKLIAVGKNCLIGANAGIGISLGDRCTVEAGLYVTAGAKISLLIAGEPEKTVKARDLSEKSGLLFRRNSQTGRLECLTNAKDFALRAELHTNN